MNTSQSTTIKVCWSAFAERLVLSSLQSNLLAGLFIALSPLCVITNVLVIWALIKSKAILDRRCQMNWILLGISVSDLMVGVVTIPLVVILFTRYQFIRWCDLEKAALFIFQVNLHFSAYSLFFIGLEYYLHLDPKIGSRNRERARKLTSNRGLVLMVTTSFFLSLCHAVISSTDYKNRTIPNTVSGILNFGLYMSCVFFVSTYLKIRKSSMQTSSVLGSERNLPNKAKMPQHVQIFAKFICLLMFVSCICFMPFCVIEFVFVGIKYIQRKPISQTLRFINFLTWVPLLLYSALNAVIVVSVKSNLRKVVLEKFNFKFQSGNNHSAYCISSAQRDRKNPPQSHISSSASSPVSTPVSSAVLNCAIAAKTCLESKAF